MRKYRVGLLVFALFVVLLLCGCNLKKTLSNIEIVQQLRETTLIEYRERANVAEYLYDSDDMDSEYVYTNEMYPFELALTEFEIDKRQTNLEDKEDIVYCTIVTEGYGIRKTAEYILRINFYDEGGWIVDSYSLEEVISFEPTDLPSAELFDKIEKKYNERLSLQKVDEISVSSVSGTIFGQSAEVKYNCIGKAEILEYDLEITAEYRLDPYSETWVYADSEYTPSFTCLEAISGRYHCEEAFKVLDMEIHFLGDNKISVVIESVRGGETYVYDELPLYFPFRGRIYAEGVMGTDLYFHPDGRTQLKGGYFFDKESTFIGSSSYSSSASSSSSTTSASGTLSAEDLVGMWMPSEGDTYVVNVYNSAMTFHSDGTYTNDGAGGTFPYEVVDGKLILNGGVNSFTFSVELNDDKMVMIGEEGNRVYYVRYESAVNEFGERLAAAKASPPEDLLS